MDLENFPLKVFRAEMIRTYSVSPWDGSSFAYWEKTLLNTAYWILIVVEKKRKSTLTLKIYNRNNHAFKNYTLYEC